MHIGGLDRLSRATRAERLDQLSADIGAACADLDVCWVGTDVVADGAKAVLVAGVPLQSDDDELRLVAVARRVLDLERGHHVRIGVHRGTAFVGDIGHPSRRTYTVMGDTVNTAARLAGLASPGDLAGQRGCRRPLARALPDRPRQRLSMKGKRAPVGHGWSGRRHPLGAGRRSLTLVGRTRELAVLRSAFVAAPGGTGRGGRDRRTARHGQEPSGRRVHR